MPALEVLSEEEVVSGPRLAYTAPARDIDAELLQAREEAFTAGYKQAVQKLAAEYDNRLRERMPRAPLAAEMIPILEGIAVLLGVRVMMAGALIATFVLALQAMDEPSVMRIVILIAFGIATVAPLCWLATRRTG